MNPADALVRLTALPGLGVWTATSTITTSHGDPDTIVLRDYGLPTMVNYAFTGDARRMPADEGGDERMCEHLAPWAGHRQRIVRLLAASGMSPPRRAPRAVQSRHPSAVTAVPAIAAADEPRVPRVARRRAECRP